MALAGTETVNELAEAVVTFALTTPKNTILFAGVVLKLDPLIVTLVPTAPDCGENELIAGCENNSLEISNITKRLLLFFRIKFDRDKVNFIILLVKYSSKIIKSLLLAGIFFIANFSFKDVLNYKGS